MADDLRELVAAEIEQELDSYTHLACIAAGNAADRVLAIPRIAAALKLLDEQERLNLGHEVKVK